MSSLFSFAATLLLCSTLDGILALSTVSRSISQSPGAELVGTQAKLKLDIGREQGTWMPPQWAESGARLLVNVEVEFTNEDPFSDIKDDFVGPPSKTKLLKVINSPSRFVGAHGTEEVIFKSGGWCLQRPLLSDPGAEASLRFWVECSSGAQRRDARISPGERINFSTGAWTDLVAMKKIERELEDTEADMKRVAEENAGEFVSSGHNMLPWLFGEIDIDLAKQALRDPASAVKHLAAQSKFDRLKLHANGLRNRLPKDDKVTLTKGLKPFAGANGSLLGPRGSLTVSRRGPMGAEQHIFGTFTLGPTENLPPGK